MEALSLKSTLLPRNLKSISFSFFLLRNVKVILLCNLSYRCVTWGSVKREHFQAILLQFATNHPDIWVIYPLMYRINCHVHLRKGFNILVTNLCILKFQASVSQVINPVLILKLFYPDQMFNCQRIFPPRFSHTLYKVAAPWFWSGFEPDILQWHQWPAVAHRRKLR